MIKDSLFREYTDVLTREGDTKEVLTKAFGMLVSEYQIAQLEIKLFPKQEEQNMNNQELVITLPIQEAFVDNGSCYEKTFSTDAEGCFGFKLYKVAGANEWGEEARNDLDMILNICYLYVGRYRLLQIVKQSSMIDVKSGLPNGHGFMEVLERKYKEGTHIHYNAYYMNLKRFGLVNRRFGQIESENIIVKYGEQLKAYAQQDECIGRLGGDNFVALIKKERTKEFLDLLKGVEVIGNLGGEEIPLSIAAAVGVYEIDDAPIDHKSVIGRCAVALSVAKRDSDKHYVVVTKELSRRIYREKQLTERFHDAIANQEFVVYYQPKVETNRYTIVGAEALARWNCDGEMISPAEFIPVLERDSSICKLDFYIFEQVCKDIAAWKAEGVEPVRTSVNFSRKHLSNPNFAKKILDLMEKYQIESQYIEVELTETVDEEEQGLLSKFMNEMSAHQICTAIDDFGTGYSSLNLLRSFPVEVLKIDKSLLDEGEFVENDQIILANIIHLAKQLNMDVVMEGVETWEQVEFLHDVDCNIVQGFLFDKPMPKKLFDQRIMNKKYDVV